MELAISNEYIVAGRLADPVTRGQTDLSQAVEWSDVLNVLLRNKVPLFALKNDPILKDCPLMVNADFIRATEAETQIWKNLRDEYGELRQALTQKGVESILFKSPGLAPSFPYTSDNLDTLVRPDDIDFCRQVLGTLGYIELRNIEEPQKYLFRKFRGGESISAIHLHGVVGWGVPFLDDAALWKRARVSEDDPCVMVPSPNDAFLITVAHAFYENKSFKLLDIARIRYCLHQGNLDFSNMEKIARERGWEDGLAFCLLLYCRLEAALYGETLIPDDVLDRARSVLSANILLSRWLENTLKRDNVHFPFYLSFFFGKILYYMKILKDSQRKLTTRIYDVVATFVWGVKHKLQISGQRGIIVSFSGIDGAGKSVHVQSLFKAFHTSEINAHIYWSRFGSSARKDDLPFHGATKPHSIDIAASLASRRQRLQNPLVRSGWLVLNLIGFIFRCTFYVRFPRWLGVVVICDRYIYDAMIEIQTSLPKDSRWPQLVEWLLARSCPRPDVAWLLDVPAEISIERQPDQNESMDAYEELSRQRLKLRSLASIYGLRVMPTNNDVDGTMSHVVRETLLKYYDNYSTWVNALLLSNPNQRNPKKAI